jgi:hypothetical protein
MFLVLQGSKSIANALYLYYREIIPSQSFQATKTLYIWIHYIFY